MVDVVVVAIAAVVVEGVVVVIACVVDVNGASAELIVLQRIIKKINTETLVLLCVLVA